MNQKWAGKMSKKRVIFKTTFLKKSVPPKSGKSQNLTFFDLFFDIFSSRRIDKKVKIVQKKGPFLTHFLAHFWPKNVKNRGTVLDRSGAPFLAQFLDLFFGHFWPIFDFDPFLTPFLTLFFNCFLLIFNVSKHQKSYNV